jgi:hypothetical protein
MKKLIINKFWLCISLAQNIWIIQCLNSPTVNIVYTDSLESYLNAKDRGYSYEPFDYEFTYTYLDRTESYLIDSMYFAPTSEMFDGINDFLEMISSKEEFKNKYLEFFLFNQELLHGIEDSHSFKNDLKKWMDPEPSFKEVLDSLENIETPSLETF